MELLIKNIRACDPQTGLDGITDIGIDGGKIVSLGKTDEHAQRVIDAKGKLCALPGLFDMHVHFRDPGLTYRRTSSQVRTPQRQAVSRASLVCRTQSRLSTPLRA